ncbi:hypothetical protein AX14_006538 [Amanita brunnescens Koide BX004]|nr:hypothetical protein AX14_006538 [Amanita brunnescens Koide BX004]
MLSYHSPMHELYPYRGMSARQQTMNWMRQSHFAHNNIIPTCSTNDIRSAYSRSSSVSDRLGNLRSARMQNTDILAHGVEFSHKCDGQMSQSNNQSEYITQHSDI